VTIFGLGADPASKLSAQVERLDRSGGKVGNAREPAGVRRSC
jgi:hypothetical protein